MQVAEQKKKKLLSEAEKKARLEQLQVFEYELIRDVKERDQRVQELTVQVFEPIKERFPKWAVRIEESLNLDE